MNIVKIIVIIAGIIVLVRPKPGSLIDGLWPMGIVINLLLTGQYFDIAVRDTVMAIGAFRWYLLLSGRGKGRLASYCPCMRHSSQIIYGLVEYGLKILSSPTHLMSI